MASAALRSADPLVALAAVCGADAVLTDPAALGWFAEDAHRAGALPFAVLRPSTREACAAAVGVATRYGVAVIPRGGGMSYTDAITPPHGHSVVIDSRCVNRVLAIDARALWVTVEAGVTWAALDAALKPHGVRAAFWGPFSGWDATVGGSIAQGTATFGTGTAGTSGANLLGLEVALADGRIIRTGMDARPGTEPFFDQYGPSLTGVFANDGGALGVKLAATLPLVPRSEHVAGLSFRFDDFPALAGAIEHVARDALATEVFAIDAAIAAQFAGDGDPIADAKRLARLARGPGGLKQAVKAVAGGRGFLKADGFHAHFVCEGRSPRDLALRLDDVRAAAAAGEPMPDTVPAMTRASPFNPLPLTDPRGRLVLPIHGIVPFAKATALHAECAAIVQAHADAAEAARVTVATSVSPVSRGALLYEPVFYWEDELTRRQAERPGGAARYGPNPAARELVEVLRSEMVAAMQRHGAAHLQIGRAYPYADGRDLTLLRAIKNVVDPQGLMNPGALGL
jgi:FAD/FMN-containing dehydrogenase